MIISFILPTIFGIYAYYRKKLTKPAILICWLFGFLISYLGGYHAFIALALTFILTLLTDKLKNNKEDKTRNFYQIMSNILTPTLCIILLDLTANNIYYLMYYCTLAASLADTFSSGFGALSKRKPINILTFKRMQKGESGAVSWLGVNAAIVAGILIGLIYYATNASTVDYLLIITMGLLGSLTDSILGVLFQAKYKCQKCKKIIEESTHCNKKSNLIKGYNFFDNNLVNFLSNILVFLISYLLLF